MKKYVLFLVCVLYAISVFAQQERWKIKLSPRETRKYWNLCTNERWDDNKNDWMPLMCAVYYNQPALRDSLIHAGVNVNEESKRWELTALWIAIQKQDIESVEMLLKTGRISDSKNHRYGNLYVACTFKDARIVQLLVKYGYVTNLDIVDNHGYTPLMMAVRFGSIETVELLLKSKVTIGGTELRDAIFNGNTDEVKLLLAYGADKKGMNSKGERAYDYIDYCISCGRISEDEGEELKILLK